MTSKGFGNKDQTQSSTDQSTKIETTTTTTIGDIGLTGKDAVALAGTLGATTTANVDKLKEIAVPLADVFSEGFNRVTQASENIAQAQKTAGQLLAENAPFIIAGLGVVVFFATRRK